LKKGIDLHRNNPPLMLIILDGFGHRANPTGNAVHHAHMPFWDKLLSSYPHTLLNASGAAVGLLDGYIGNSEVGHKTMGAGRIVKSILKIFHEAIDDGSFFNNQLLTAHFQKLKESGHALHLMGLLSDAGVHSHEYHLHALIKLAHKVGITNVFIHAFLDGRDVPPQSAKIYLERLDQVCSDTGCGKLATLHGRFYAMDRDHNWDRTKASYDVLTSGDPLRQGSGQASIQFPTEITQGDPSRHSPKGLAPQDERPDNTNNNSKTPDFYENNQLDLKSARPEEQFAELRLEGSERSWRTVLENSYANNITDEYIQPTVLDPAGTIQPGDGIVFFNFRPDRARQLTESFINPAFNHFPVKNLTSTASTLSFFITTTRYNNDFARFNNDIIFKEESIDHTLLDEIAIQKPTDNSVFIIAETEKYAHVTYFFRGMVDKQLPNETRILVPSLKERNYINHPEMSAPEITQHLLSSLQTKPAFFYLVNYANADMVGHAGNFDATVKACEILDAQLAQLYEEVVEKLDGTLIITADHGNAEEQRDAADNPHTAHTCNPVPFVIANKKLIKSHSFGSINSPRWFETKPSVSPHHERGEWGARPEEQQSCVSKGRPDQQNLGLANIAPTLLHCMGLSIPNHMTKQTIFSKEIFMNKRLTTRNERLWASAVHMPTLTLIWSIYFVYHTCATHSLFTSLQESFFSLDKIPVTPLIFTMLSLGIAHVIRYAKPHSDFVQDQVLQAFAFNTSLLKWYGVGFLGATLGNLLKIPLITLIFFGIMTATSINCLIQAFWGVWTSMRGKSYRYWYLFK